MVLNTSLAVVSRAHNSGCGAHTFSSARSFVLTCARTHACLCSTGHSCAHICQNSHFLTMVLIQLYSNCSIFQKLHLYIGHSHVVVMELEIACNIGDCINHIAARMTQSACWVLGLLIVTINLQDRCSKPLVQFFWVQSKFHQLY